MTATVGAYGFTASDWKELGYPLDLWLRWHLGIFDEVALVSYGPVERPRHPSSGLRYTEFPYRPNDGYPWSIDALKEGQALLSTDWKFMLATDEFVAAKPDARKLLAPYSYIVRERHLWGSVGYELVGGEAATYIMPPSQVRVHRGFVPYRLDDLMVSYGSPSDLELWHTGYARDPDLLGRRLVTKIGNEAAAGVQENKGVLKYVGRGFYDSHRQLFPGSNLLRIDLSKLPAVLRENAKRFEWWDPVEPPPLKG